MYKMSSSSWHEKDLLYSNYEKFVKVTAENADNIIRNYNFNNLETNWYDWSRDLLNLYDKCSKTGDHEKAYMLLKLFVDGLSKLTESKFYKNKMFKNMDDLIGIENSLNKSKIDLENLKNGIKLCYLKKEAKYRPEKKKEKKREYSGMKVFLKQLLLKIPIFFHLLYSLLIDSITRKKSIVKIPVLKDGQHIPEKDDLIKMALDKIQNIFELELKLYKNQWIELNGLRNRVNFANRLLNKNLINIMSKKVYIKDFGVLNDNLVFLHNLNPLKNSLLKIANQLLGNTKSIFKLNIKLNYDHCQNDVIEIYVTFFYNFVELNSVSDCVYKEVSRKLINNLSVCVIDVTKYSNLISTANWKEFEAENLNEKLIGNYVYYSLANSLGQSQILLIGVKCYLDSIKSKIEPFLRGYELKNIEIPLKEEDVG